MLREPLAARPPPEGLRGGTRIGADSERRLSLLELDWIDDEEPSVLLVGAGHSMQTALGAALTRRGIYVETVERGAVLDAVVAATPSLIVVVGEAARDGAESVLSRLRRTEHGALVPVAVLPDAANLEARLRAFRNGASAVIPPSASVDALAERLANLARAKDRLAPAPAGEATLSDLLDAIGSKVAAEVLPESKLRRVDFDTVRLAFGDGRRVVELIDEFSAAVHDTVASVERVEYQLGKQHTTAELLGEQAMAEARSLANVAGVRLLIVDPDSGRADQLAQVLRQRGADVVITGPHPSDHAFERLRQFDPIVIVVVSADARRRARAFLKRVSGDSRLRWASLVEAGLESKADALDADQIAEELLGSLAAAFEPDRSFRTRAELEDSFDSRLEVMGAARWLRSVAGCRHGVRLSVHNKELSIRIDVSEGLVVGAGAQLPGAGAKPIEGVAALAAFMALDSGRVDVERIAEPAVVNVMTPVEAALNLADVEPAVVFESRPSAAGHAALPRKSFRALFSLRKHDLSDWLFRAAFASLGLLFVVLVVLLLVRRQGADADQQQGRTVASARETARTQGSEAAQPLHQSAPQTSDPEQLLLERAESGDRAALTELEQREPRSVETALTLSRGRLALRRAEALALCGRIQKDAALLADREMHSELIKAGRDSTIASEVLAAIAELPGPTSADLIYTVWVGTHLRSDATRLAEGLLDTAVLRAKASPALAVALDLRNAESCEDYQAVLPRAIEQGDKRSFHLLARLTKRTGCGARKTRDCYPCLRKDRGKQLQQAMTATRKRPAPRLGF